MPTFKNGEWGAGTWGAGAWGGEPGPFVLQDVIAYRENVIRLAFGKPVYFSKILDPLDGSAVAKYTVGIVPGSMGLDGNIVRPVTAIHVDQPGIADDIAPAALGRIVDVYLDRPMTPYPAIYTITVEDLLSADMMDLLVPTTVQVQAVYKQIQPPQVNTARPSRDIANPQTLSAALDPIPDPLSPFTLGSIRVDDSGDYAFDEGIVNLKKRVLRRLVTARGAFAHLPTYGVGIPQNAKKLGSPIFVQALAADAQAQIATEPDVAKCLVKPVIDPNTPGLVRFQVIVQPKVGQPAKFDVPFKVEA